MHEGKKHIGLRVHGNWVGPGWSAGKRQGSTLDYSVPYIDDFDRTGREHDFDYDIGNNLETADYNFFKDNFLKGNPFTWTGLKRWGSTAVIGAQAVGRTLGLIPKQAKFRRLTSFPEKNMVPGTPRKKYGAGYVLPPTPRKSPKKRKATGVGKSVVKKAKTVGGSRKPAGYVAANAYNGNRGNRSGKRSGKKSVPDKFNVIKFKRLSRKKRRRRGYDLVHFVAENRGAIVDPESVYIGHSIPSSKLVLNMLKRLCKDMYKKAGITIIDYRDRTADLSDLCFWSIRWRDTQTSSTIRIAAVEVFNRLGGAKTYDQVCGEMLNAIRTAGGNMSSNAGLKIDWQISELATDNATAKRIHSLIDLKYYYMDISYKNTLRVQNTTAATAGVGDAYESDNITSNPLSVTCYESKRQTNGFFINHVFPGDSVAVGTESPFIADELTGVIAVDPGVVGNGTTMTNTFKKPPAPTVFDAAKKGGKTTIPPGGFLQSIVDYNGTFSFPTMMNKLGMFIFQSGAQQHIPIGNVKLYGMEHYMKAPVADADINIQWQSVYKMTIGSHYGKQKTAAYVEVN